MNTRTKRQLLNFLMEMLIYGLLLLICFLAVLRLLGEPLNQLSHLNSLVLAFAALLNIDAYQRMLTKERSKTQDYLKSVQSRFSSLPVDSEFVVVVGSAAAAAILNDIRRNDVDLVVMSGQGRSEFGRWIHGSVAKEVLPGANCAILAVRDESKSIKRTVQLESFEPTLS